MSQYLKRLATLVMGIALSPTFSSLPALAHPTLAPHPHGDGKVFFEEDGKEDGDHDHNHLARHSVQGSVAEDHVHDAFAVWDNRIYRYDVGNATVEGGVRADFWHGFIQRGMEPRYRFIDGLGASRTFDATSKGIIAAAIAEWRDAARAQSALRITEDGRGLVTGLNLVQAEGPQFEIRIGFFDGLREHTPDKAAGLWLVSDAQIWTGSGLTVADLDTSPILAFDDDINWLFDTTRAPDANQLDFFTMALHELGHVFGLVHPLNDMPGNLMRTNIALEANDGHTLRRVDRSSANGAAELYTQPIPELSTFGQLTAGILLMAFALRKRLVSGCSAVRLRLEARMPTAAISLAQVRRVAAFISIRVAFDSSSIARSNRSRPRALSTRL